MTTGPNRFFDDFAKLMTDAAGAAQGLRKEAETVFQAQAEKFLASMDLVQREEFEAMKEAALAAKAESSGLAERVDALEARIAKLEGK